MTPDFDVQVVGEINHDLILTGDDAPAFWQIEYLVGTDTLIITVTCKVGPWKNC
jgi:hypothetical protein